MTADDELIEFPPHPAPPSTRQRRSVIRPQMDGDVYDKQDTEEIPVPTPGVLAEQACRRAAQALMACDGVDTATLEILAQRPQGGDSPTNLQILLSRVSWSALQAQRG